MSPLVALVTGAANGIGKAIAKRLIADGFFVVAIDIDVQAGASMETEFGIEAVSFINADISQESEVVRLFEVVQKKFPGLHVLVNNAGIIRDNMIWNMTTEEYDSVLSVNLRGTWLMCRQAAIVMRQQKSGRIINITSRAWLGNRGQSNYSASKAGVVGLTRVLALELARDHILVNAIAPGLIETTLTKGLDANILKQLIDAQPTREMGKPEDIAHFVSFLADHRTRFITGQTIYVDGGKSIGSAM